MNLDFRKEILISGLRFTNPGETKPGRGQDIGKRPLTCNTYPGGQVDQIEIFGCQKQIKPRPGSRASIGREVFRRKIKCYSFREYKMGNINFRIKQRSDITGSEDATSCQPGVVIGQRIG